MYSSEESKLFSELLKFLNSLGFDFYVGNEIEMTDSMKHVYRSIDLKNDIKLEVTYEFLYFYIKEGNYYDMLLEVFPEHYSLIPNSTIYHYGHHIYPRNRTKDVLGDFGNFSI